MTMSADGQGITVKSVKGLEKPTCFQYDFQTLLFHLGGCCLEDTLLQNIF